MQVSQNWPPTPHISSFQRIPQKYDHSGPERQQSFFKNEVRNKGEMFNMGCALLLLSVQNGYVGGIICHNNELGKFILLKRKMPFLLAPWRTIQVVWITVLDHCCEDEALKKDRLPSKQVTRFLSFDNFFQSNPLSIQLMSFRGKRRSSKFIKEVEQTKANSIQNEVCRKIRIAGPENFAFGLMYSLDPKPATSMDLNENNRTIKML